FACLKLLHEAGHLLVAGEEGVAIATPLTLPSVEASHPGTALHRLESYPRCRGVLCDLALAGPAFGGLCSLAAFLWGLFLTAQADTAALEVFPRLPAGFLDHSLLIGLATNLFLPHYISAGGDGGGASPVGGGGAVRDAGERAATAAVRGHGRRGGGQEHVGQ
ncbi:unnamed protein product, partial [Phaeothamnion confervicola]